MATKLCKFSLLDAAFLNHSPSEIAAAAVILSINIFNKEIKRECFFKQSYNGFVYLNKDLWDSEMKMHTSIDLVTLNVVLEKLAKFMMLNLKNHYLNGFIL